MENKLGEIKEIKVAQNIRYLGLIIQDKKDIIENLRETIVG